MKQIAAVLGTIAQVALWLAATGMVLMTAFVAWQVWGRYVLNSSPNWTEPVSVLLMGWFIFLGSAVGTREGFHLSFDLISHLVPRQARTVMDFTSDLVVLVFGIGMVFYGAQLARGTWSSTMPALHISGAHVFFPLIGGGVLTVLFTLERLARRICGLPQIQPGSAHAHGVTEA